MRASPALAAALPRAALATLLGLAGAGCDGPQRPPLAAPDTRPHLLLVVLDTARADRLGVYGYARDTSPALDAFAARSRVFERALASSNWTLPSHASIFTGLPPSAHGAIGSEGWLSDRFDTLAERLRDAGYETYLFSANPFVSGQHNLDQGFEVRAYAWEQPWSAQVAAYMEQRDYPGEVRRSRFVPYKDAGDVIRRGFLAWLRQRDPERPFFAVLNLMEAHRPWYATRAERGAFLAPQQVERSIAMDHSYRARHAWSFGYGGYDARDLEALGGLYDASLRHLDAIVGDLLAGLEEGGWLEHSAVAITSDHGEHLGDHDLLGHEYSLYEGLLRVPLIVHHPPRFAPGRSAGPVQTLDLYPTFLELAGLPAPAGAAGRSLLAPPRAGRALVAEYLDPKRKPLDAVAKLHPDLDRTRWLRPLRALERDGEKLIWAGGGSAQLFAVADDPAEQRDLAGVRAERVAALRQQLPPWAPAAEPERRPAGPLDPLRRRLLEAIGYLDSEAD